MEVLISAAQVFGPPPSNHATSSLPQHGFARNSRWEFLGKSSSESGSISKSGTGDDCVKLDFGLFSSKLSPEARKAWGYDFGLIYSVTLGRDSLQTMLNVRNEGDKAFEFQMLLHSYFRVKVQTATALLVNAAILTRHVYAGHKSNVADWTARYHIY